MRTRKAEWDDKETGKHYVGKEKRTVQIGVAGVYLTLCDQCASELEKALSEKEIIFDNDGPTVRIKWDYVDGSDEK